VEKGIHRQSILRNKMVFTILCLSLPCHVMSRCVGLKHLNYLCKWDGQLCEVERAGGSASIGTATRFLFVHVTPACLVFNPSGTVFSGSFLSREMPAGAANFLDCRRI
jgi:hypothetical protein